MWKDCQCGEARATTAEGQSRAGQTTLAWGEETFVGGAGEGQEAHAGGAKAQRGEAVAGGRGEAKEFAGTGTAQVG